MPGLSDISFETFSIIRTILNRSESTLRGFSCFIKQLGQVFELLYTFHFLFVYFLIMHFPKMPRERDLEELLCAIKGRQNMM